MTREEARALAIGVEVRHRDHPGVVWRVTDTAIVSNRRPSIRPDYYGTGIPEPPPWRVPVTCGPATIGGVYYLTYGLAITPDSADEWELVR